MRLSSCLFKFANLCSSTINQGCAADTWKIGVCRANFILLSLTNYSCQLLELEVSVTFWIRTLTDSSWVFVPEMTIGAKAHKTYLLKRRCIIRGSNKLPVLTNVTDAPEPTAVLSTRDAWCLHSDWIQNRLSFLWCPYISNSENLWLKSRGYGSGFNY